MPQNKTKSNKKEKNEATEDRHIYAYNPVFYKSNDALNAPIVTVPIAGAGPLQDTTPDPDNPQSVQFIPYRQSSEDQFWCREFDGGWTLRTATEIATECGPGKWTLGRGGWPYFTRTPPST